MFQKDELVKVVFDQILVKIRNAYEEGNPGMSGDITNQNVSFHAHTSKSQHSHLQMADIENYTMEGLLQHFAILGYVNPQQVNNRKLSVRLVIEDRYLPQDEFWDDRAAGKSAQVSGLQSSLPHKSSAVLSLRKRKVVEEEGEDLGSNGGSEGSIHRSGSLLVRKSAFRPRILYARDVILQTFTFTKVAYDQGTRKFTHEHNQKEIMLSPDWRQDLEQGMHRNRDSAFLGSGYSKNAFYARFGGKEFAFVQCKPQFSEDENSKFLHAEFENLADAHLLAEEFKDELRKIGLQFPNFYFNYDDAFLGVLEPEFYEQLSEIANYKEFLATPLLPCSEADPQIAKYTGNDDVGEAPKDRLTSLMHAYMHYTYVMTKKTLLICDLQGTFNKDKVLCLIDPQSHRLAIHTTCSCSSVQCPDFSNDDNSNERVYWDGGRLKMVAYIKHHTEDENGCEQNLFCKALQLLDVKVV
ncbi:hypothetical protein GYMLUDRAFT_1004687 [Collybiopsis luxurians FD-317 M1]|uniref:Alpha-type protein kinase domain-containing protein n=1 Tax=Collybiopsis luxurians FD-317 M1 TaxID=944289 RepID=A0A0D0B751_9AGAR|nr:hypothetical protein GYMLUDRAFT_1004687 [Collybiopsis luxurians FD-317 M1]